MRQSSPPGFLATSRHHRITMHPSREAAAIETSAETLVSPSCHAQMRLVILVTVRWPSKMTAPAAPDDIDRGSPWKTKCVPALQSLTHAVDTSGSTCHWT